MKILLIVAHPHLEDSRVNRSFVKAIQHYHNVTVHNLYKEYPNEIINAERERSILLDYDRVVLQFPLYWYSTPSLLKKWQDEVLGYGWAYGPEGDNLHGKELMIVTTAGGSEYAYMAGGSNQFTMSELLRPLQATSNLIGMKYLMPFVFYKSMMAEPNEVTTASKRFVEHVLNENLGHNNR